VYLDDTKRCDELHACQARRTAPIAQHLVDGSDAFSPMAQVGSLKTVRVYVAGPVHEVNRGKEER
jgi:hypothetical protein